MIARIGIASVAAALLVAIDGASGGAQSSPPRTLLLVIAGVGGDPAYGERFLRQALAMRDAAVGRLALPDSDVVVLTEDPTRDPRRVRLASTKANVERAFAELATRARAGDQVVVLLIGHGSGSDAESRFNLPGPDISARDLDALLGRLPTTRIAVIDASSASGDWLPVLSREGRVIVTATRSGFERNETMFARYFIEAFAKDGADTDKDGRVSLLEAYGYARREVARQYDSDRRLLTEHAQLDDDGDGKGSAEPDGRAERRLAAATFLAPGAASVTTVASDDPRVRELALARDRAATRVDSLRRRKVAMDSTAYERELEGLLLELARTTQALRAAEARGRKP